MTIRRAELGDAQTIYEMDAIAWSDGERPLRLDERKELLQSDNYAFVALNGSIIVGVIVAEQISCEPHNIEIKRLLTHPKHREQGYGSKLVQGIAAIADNTNKKVFASPNSAHTGARELYLGLGFFEEELIPLGNGNVLHGMTHLLPEARL